MTQEQKKKTGKQRHGKKAKEALDTNGLCAQGLKRER